MGQYILLHMIVILGLAWWCAVQNSPPIVSYLLPRRLTFWIGGGVFAMGVFVAYEGAYATGSPPAFMGGLIQCFVGGWLMLAPAAHMHGTEEFSHTLKTLAALLAGLVGVMYLMFYIRTPAGVALLNAWLLLFGALFTTIWRRVCR
jgi:hypothetical protein